MTATAVRLERRAQPWQAYGSSCRDWYDNFLIFVSFAFNGVVIGYAWTWTAAAP